jgi:hypothetical protein
MDFGFHVNSELQIYYRRALGYFACSRGTISIDSKNAAAS